MRTDAKCQLYFAAKQSKSVNSEAHALSWRAVASDKLTSIYDLPRMIPALPLSSLSKSVRRISKSRSYRVLPCNSRVGFEKTATQASAIGTATHANVHTPSAFLTAFTSPYACQLTVLVAVARIIRATQFMPA